MYFSINKAIEQFDNDVNEFHQCVSKNRTLSDCADAIMALRNLDDAKRAKALDVLCHGNIAGSFLNDFDCVLNVDEYMRVPNALSNLIDRLEYNIVDDGYLCLCKIGVNNLHCTTFYDYFLSTNENWEKQMDVANEWVDRRGGIWIKPKAVSIEMVWFDNIENFTELLKILGNASNYDKLSQLKDNCIEKFFKSRQEK